MPSNADWRLPITMKTEGIPQSIAALKRIRKGLKPAGKRGVRRAVKYLLKQTIPVTPIDKGPLRRSGKAEVREGEMGQIIGQISFYIYYAIWVHEDLTKYHKPGTYAKFLERTVRNRYHQTVARGMIADELVREEMKHL